MEQRSPSTNPANMGRYTGIDWVFQKPKEISQRLLWLRPMKTKKTKRRRTSPINRHGIGFTPLL
jgi:hypothetical protein